MNHKTFGYMLATLALVCQSAFAEPNSKLKTVNITFIEALDSKDTTSSERFRQDYEKAIQSGIALVAKDVSKCGYQIASQMSFYKASDPIQAKEDAEKAVKNNSWMIVGPRRSNHYLVAVKGAGAVPTVSLMASSDEVATLGPSHLSLVPTNEAMAKAAAAEAKARTKGMKNGKYISVVSDDCLYCKGFAAQFDKEAQRLGLTAAASIPVLGESPDVATIQRAIEQHQPAFVLLPNYSIVSGFLIAKIQEMNKTIFFVGGDGWGVDFGFVENGPDIKGASGFTVRGNPPVDQGLATFGLGKQVLKSSDKVASAASLALLKILDDTSRLLCKHRPKDATAFQDVFAQHGRSYFSAPWGVSVYDLTQGSIAYRKSIKGI